MLSLLELKFLHTRHGPILIYTAFHVKTLRQTSVVEGAAHLLAVEEPLEEQGSELSKFCSTYSEGGVNEMA